MQPKEYFKPADATHYLKGRWGTMYYKMHHGTKAWLFWYCGPSGNRWIPSINEPTEPQPKPLKEQK